MDTGRDERCEKCEYYRGLVWHTDESKSYGWCIVNAKHNPKNPFDDGYKGTRLLANCGEFQPKGADDVRTNG